MPDESKRLILRRIVVRFSFYILIFFICWSLDIVTNLISMVDENCSIYAFFFVYTFFRNLQGLLNCLVYGMINLKIRKRFTESILSAVVATWELFLSPMLVLPAFVAYIKLLLKPYWPGSDSSEKIYVCISDELQKNQIHTYGKVPAHYYYSNTPDGAESSIEEEARRSVLLSLEGLDKENDISKGKEKADAVDQEQQMETEERKSG